jgi:alanyl-tRNA synthetase
MVKIKIDKIRRDNLKKLHLATHIISMSAKKILGNHIWQHGSNLNEEYGTLDITHYKNINFSDLKEIEDFANKIVFESLPVKFENIDRSLAEKKYGYSIYQGGAIPLSKLRIVKIGEHLDIQACGGLHFENTKQVELIKIENAQRIQDGVIRLKYCVSNFALNYIKKKEKIIDDLKELYKVNDDDILKASQKFFEKTKEFSKSYDKLKDELNKLIINQIINSNDEEHKINFQLEMKDLMKIVDEIKSKKEKFIIKTFNFIFSTNNVKHSFEFKKEIKKKGYSIYVI